MLNSRPSRFALPAVLAALVLAGSTAPMASAAAQRYASPGGSDQAACTSAAPCSLTKAVNGANGGDEVIVAPGDYPLTAPGLTASWITIHGVADQPRPRLLFNAAPTPAMMLDHSTLRYVEVDQAPDDLGIALNPVNASVVDQVIVRGTGQPNWPAVLSGEGSNAIRNSIIVAPGSNGTAIQTVANGAFAGSTFRNVTAIATGSGGVAIRAGASGPSGYAGILARNVIARGGTGGSAFSFVAATDNSGATAKITVDHSNWQGGYTWGSNASIVDGGNNQSSAPGFVSAARGDYRQAPGSPTINAGLSEIIDGDFDVEGDPRQLGSSIDIGADEFVMAPTATTGPVSAVTEHSARLSGSVDTKYAPTDYHFEYGPTTAYGSVTPTAQAGSGGTVTTMGTVGALSPATTYHYRLVAANSGGTVQGADRTFTTASIPSPAPGPPPPAPAPSPPFAGVQLVSPKLAYARRAIPVRLRCPAVTHGRCSGRTKLTARRRSSSRRVTVGRARFSIAPGASARVKVRVSRAGRRLLGSTPRLRGRAVNAARDGAGQSKTTVARVTIRRRHR